MPVTIYHVETGNFYVALTDGRLTGIVKNTDANVDPCTIRVDCLDATFERTHVHVADRNVYMDNSKLYLDAADIVTFADWLRSQMPSASTKAFGDALFKMFPGSMQFRDVLIAAGNIVCAPNVKRPAQGEQLYFLAAAKASDPDGFAELAKAYAASVAPKVAQ
ncbi:hypothetical protein NKI51_22405 [Mesorhizobium australicum]|uniref:hypothetical protein n=1 Tax=Mesorhizobium australicum TaxID=536018 RepID=UPI003337C044